MFWSGNYIVVRELNFLLKEENVTLSQVLEADDILQECKADNKNLMQFLTRPDILAELITLITEEPPQNVELTSQYRLASIACEVLTSDLSTLSDKLSMDVTQMNRLCDFISKPPPLNPLLASYFSKTVEMLLERSTKQDWYLYHIVCLRVLDFFKSRRDFLPNLLRHMATSAIAETFRYFIRLDDLFNKIVMEWFEEHQLLESLIQVVCGGYLPEDGADEKGQLDASEKQLNHTQHTAAEAGRPARRWLCARLQAVASANAASLLCDVIVCGDTRTRTMDTLITRLQSEEYIRLLLQSMFTSPPHARAFAVVNGCRLLLASLTQEPISVGGEAEAERSGVELGVAPHLPLLHQALLHDPRGPRPGLGLPRLQLAELVACLALSELDEICTALRALGTMGVLVDMMFHYPHNNFLHAEVYALVKHALANRVFRTQYAKHLLLECDLLTRLMDVFEENENKKPTGDGDNSAPETRAAYMGHVVMMLEKIARALDANDGELTRLLPAPLLQRWSGFCEPFLQLVQQRHVPLGGYYPSENIYEVENMADSLAAEYDFHDMSATATLDDIGDDLAADGLNELQLMGAGNDLEADDFANSPAVQQIKKAVSDFWERASQRFDDDAWDDAPAAERAGDDTGAAPGDHFPNDNTSSTWLPWEQEAGPAGPAGPEAGAGAGWAQFDALPAPPAPVDPFAPQASPLPGAPPSSGAGDEEFSPFWPPQPGPANETHAQPDTSDDSQQLERSVQELQLDDASSVSLANHLLTAMSALPPDQLATLVNSGLDLPVTPAVTPDDACDVHAADVANHNTCVSSDTAADNEAPASSYSASADAGGTSNVPADSGGSLTVDTGSSFTADMSSAVSADTGSSSCDTGNSSCDTASSSCDTGSSSCDAGGDS